MSDLLRRDLILTIVGSGFSAVVASGFRKGVPAGARLLVCE